MRGRSSSGACLGPPRRAIRSAVRLAVYAFSAFMVAAVAAPGVIPGMQDSFPFSTYPMFSRRRPDVAWMATAKAVRADGSRAPIAARDIASSEPMQTLSTLKRALNGGPEAARALCEAIAGRLDPEGVVGVELRWERHRVIGYFKGQTEPEATRRVFQCSVSRSVAGSSAR